MRAKINELVAKFIECGVCNYERSFLFPESLQFGSFAWHCPNCNQLWKGLLSKRGVVSLKKHTAIPSVILIRLTDATNPSMIITQKSKLSEKGLNHQESGKDSFEVDVLYLFATEPDNVLNPHGFPEYTAVA